MKELLDLPIYKILKNENKYKNALNNRIKRLQKWQPKSGLNTNQQFDEAIKLTRECHEAAEIIKKSLNIFSTTLSETNEEALSRVFVNSEKEISKSIIKLKTEQQTPIIIDRSLQLRTVAKELILKAMHEKTDKERSLDEFISDKITKYDEWEKISIKQNVAMLYFSLDTYKSHKRTLSLMMETGLIIRGLLYVGVIDTEGSKLDRKVLNDHLNAIAMDALGIVLPGIGAAKAFKEYLDEFYFEDAKPKAIEDAKFVENYLIKYQATLLAWKLFAEQYNQSLELLLKLYLGYWPELDNNDG